MASLISKKWNIAPAPTPDVAAELGGYSSIVARALAQRGLTTRAAAEVFLAGEAAGSTDPLLMTGVPETVERLGRALARREKIAVYGDYDVDGVTATALLVQVLAALGGDVRPYIPHREDEGYGLNHEALNTLAGEGVGMVVTVDCGIRSLAEADTARALGLDLVITDHHVPGDEIPAAFAVINPKQAGDGYPEKMLAGVGIAYKLAQALVRAGGGKGNGAAGGDGNAAIKASDVLDLVALGSVADLAPLAGENRLLVRQGLQVMNRPPDRLRREGLRAMYLSAGIKPGKLDAGTIGFVLGPRLNAAGRLESALDAYELMTTTDLYRAGQLAQQLEVQNRERQALTRETHQRARALAVTNQTDSHLLFAAHRDFRHGIVGLAASRLTEEFYRPSIVARIEDDAVRGSCRSIREFHITNALDECRDLLLKHGGHAAAAGFTVAPTNLAELETRLRAIAERELAGLDLRPTVHIDSEARFAELTPALAAELARFEPCGFGNPAPVLATRGARVRGLRTMGSEGAHLRLNLIQDGVALDAIGFGLGAWAQRIDVGSVVDLAYTFEIDEWNGERRLQMKLRDLRLSE